MGVYAEPSSKSGRFPMNVSLEVIRAESQFPDEFSSGVSGGETLRCRTTGITSTPPA